MKRVNDSITTVARQMALLSAVAFLWPGPAVFADNDDASPTGSPAATGYYGLFDWLDHRSQYGTDIFPEPFLVDFTNREDNELVLNWLYSTSPGHVHSNSLEAEVSKGFGNLTIELGTSYDFVSGPSQTAHGFGDIELSARHPIHQFVSSDGAIDNTFGVGAGLGIPVNTAFSRNTDLDPRIFDALRLRNFTVQTVLDYSMQVGGGNDSGLHTFGYGCALGYAFKDPMEGVEYLFPVFELDGARDINRYNGHNSLTGNIAVRINLSRIAGLEPHLGLGYVFPIDKGAQQDLHSGLFTSLIIQW